MKTLFIFLLPFISLKGFAQIDSNATKKALELEARDWLFMSAYIHNNDNFERLYDSVKSRIWVLTNPNSTVKGKIDSISVGNLIAISQRLRAQPYGLSVAVFTRINNAIRAVDDDYLQSRLDEMDSYYLDDNYKVLLATELERLKRVRQ